MVIALLKSLLINWVDDSDHPVVLIVLDAILRVDGGFANTSVLLEALIKLFVEVLETQVEDLFWRIHLRDIEVWWNKAFLKII